jgi:hypothetical protein
VFKPMHGLYGTIQATINSGATSIILDSDSIALLKARLGNGNHTYAVLHSGVSYEVVKILSVQANNISVLRAQDGTTATGFPSGAALDFVLGESAIQDILSEKMLTETIVTGSGTAVVTRLGLNNYNIYVPPVNLTSQSPDIIVGGSYPNYVLSAPIKSDCCA